MRRRDGGGSCGDPPWKRDRSCKVVRPERLSPRRSPPRHRRREDLVDGRRFFVAVMEARTERGERGGCCLGKVKVN